MDLVERTFRAYFTVFQMGDPRAITPYYHIPSLVMSREGSFAINTVREAEQLFERMLYALRSRGYSRSVLTDVQVRPLADDTALLNARAERYTRDDELLEKMSALYTMRREEETWRISSVLVYDPERSFDLAYSGDP